MKVVSGKRVLSMLLVVNMVLTMFATSLVVHGADEDVFPVSREELIGSIRWENAIDGENGVDYSVIDTKAYLPYDSDICVNLGNLKLDTSSSNMNGVSILSIAFVLFSDDTGDKVYSPEYKAENGVIDAKPYLYNGSDGSYVAYLKCEKEGRSEVFKISSNDLVNLWGFCSVSKDKVGINVDSVNLGDAELYPVNSGKTELLKNSGNLVIHLSQGIVSDIDVRKSRLLFNGTRLSLSDKLDLDSNSIIVNYNELVDLFNYGDNVVKLKLCNNYLSASSNIVHFNYDNNFVSISAVGLIDGNSIYNYSTQSGSSNFPVFVNGSDLYVKDDVKVRVNLDVSRVSTDYSVYVVKKDLSSNGGNSEVETRVKLKDVDDKTRGFSFKIDEPNKAYFLRVKYGTTRVVDTNIFGNCDSTDVIVHTDSNEPTVNTSIWYKNNTEVPDNKYYEDESHKVNYEDEKWLDKVVRVFFMVSDDTGVDDKVYLSIGYYNAKGDKLTKVLKSLPYMESNDDSELGNALVKSKRYYIDLDTRDVPKSANGKYVFTFKGYDKLHRFVDCEVVVNLDLSSPACEEVSIIGVNSTDGKYYQNGSVRMDKISFTDMESGLDEIRYYNDGSIFDKDNNAIADMIESCDGVNRYEIVKNFNFGNSLDVEKGLIVVYDRVGNYQKYSIKSLIIKANGSGSEEDIVTDNAPPEVSMSIPESDYSNDGVYWYTDVPEISFNIVEDNLKAIQVYVNGYYRNELGLDNVLIGKDQINVYKFDNAASIDDGITSVKFLVMDKAGNSSECEVKFGLDRYSPDVFVSTADSFSKKKGTDVYLNSSIRVVISGDDKGGSGIDTYYLGDMSNTTGEFIITSGGVYDVRVVDNMGHTTDKGNLLSVLGWGGDRLVIDSIAPAINVNKDVSESSYKSNWYSSDVNYTLSVSDNVGLDKIVVSVNGHEEIITIDDLDVKSQDISISTSKYTENSDGGYSIGVSVTDNSGLVSNWDTLIYIDKNNPVISGFTIGGNVNTLFGKYVYIFDGKGTVQISVRDNGVSSGIKSIRYKLSDSDWKEVNTNGDTVCTVNIPEDYKGTISAYVIDNVGHSSDVAMSYAFVSEGSNTSVNHSSIKINLPLSNGYDTNNVPLFNSDIISNISVTCDWSGIAYMEWGIGDKTYGFIDDFSKASSWDGNLPLRYSSDFSLSGNSNSLKLWVRVKDNAGYISEVSRLFSIDKDVPTVDVKFSDGSNNTYYSGNREATITVSDRNFNSSDISISGSYGRLGTWSNSGSKWTNVMTFENDGNYDFELYVSDMAGNISDTYNSSNFIIDTIDPELYVSWNNNSFKNGKYYSSDRTATVKVIEDNFDSSLMTISGASVSNWVSDGNVHTAVIECKSGSHSFSISGKDLAGHRVSSDFNSGEFIVDTDKPVINVLGVTQGVSYKGDVNIFITVKDDNLDDLLTTVKLKGTDKEATSIYGGFEDGVLTFSYNDFSKVEEVDGVYILSVVAVDLAGNTSTENIEFSVNRFGSKYSFSNKSDIGDYLNASKDIEITESNVDRIDIDKVKVIVTLDGKATELSADSIRIVESRKDNRYFYTYYIDKDIFEKEGKYTIQVYSSSGDGTKYTSVAEEYSFIIDKTSPSIVISGIESGKTYQGSSRRVTIDVRDSYGVKDITVFLNGNMADVVKENGLYILNVSEDINSQKLEVIATDLAGNVSSMQVDNFRISSTIESYIEDQPWVRLVVIVAAILIVLLIIILVVLLNKGRKREKRKLRETQEYLSSKGTSGNIGSSSGDDSDRTNIMGSDPDDSKTDLL